MGAEVGRSEGRRCGREAAAAEALKLFTIGITKEKVALLKKTFADLGTAEGVRVGKTIAREAAAKVRSHQVPHRSDMIFLSERRGGGVQVWAGAGQEVRGGGCSQTEGERGEEDQGGGGESSGDHGH